jgi:hypothetical protein
LKVIRKVGKLSTINQFKENGIDLIPVINAGDYKKIFKKMLPPDAEIKEHKIVGTSRLFYFTVSKQFHMVGITNNHFETDKQRG